jgi:hypothetical protein
MRRLVEHEAGHIVKCLYTCPKSALVFLHSNFDGLGVAVRLAPAGPWDQRGPR